jgi:hypothetical protein
MLISHGEKVHVVSRREFETDVRRHFIGVVTEASESAVRVRGYVFVYDKLHAQFIKRPDLRERLVPFVDGSVIINILPPEADIESAYYRAGEDGRLCVTDGSSFEMCIDEFGVK